MGVSIPRRGRLVTAPSYRQSTDVSCVCLLRSHCTRSLDPPLGGAPALLQSGRPRQLYRLYSERCLSHWRVRAVYPPPGPPRCTGPSLAPPAGISRCSQARGRTLPPSVHTVLFVLVSVHSWNNWARWSFPSKLDVSAEDVAAQSSSWKSSAGPFHFDLNLALLILLIGSLA